MCSCGLKESKSIYPHSHKTSLHTSSSSHTTSIVFPAISQVFQSTNNNRQHFPSFGEVREKGETIYNSRLPQKNRYSGQRRNWICLKKIQKSFLDVMRSMHLILDNFKIILHFHKLCVCAWKTRQENENKRNGEKKDHYNTHAYMFN